MTDDVRTLLTSRIKPKVDRRNASFNLNRQESMADLEAEESTVDLQAEETTTNAQSDADSSLVESSLPNQLQEEKQSQELQVELENLPIIGKRLAVHLEQEIRGDLLKLCDQEEITPETFIEAAYALLQNQPKLVNKVITEAKKRLKQRKRAGLIRRTLSMMDTCRR